MFKFTALQRSGAPALRRSGAPALQHSREIEIETTIKPKLRFKGNYDQD